MAKRKMPKRTKNDLLSNSEKTIVLEYKLRTGYYKKIIETDVKHTQHLSFYLSQHIITWLFMSTSLFQIFFAFCQFKVVHNYTTKSGRELGNPESVSSFCSASSTCRITLQWHDHALRLNKNWSNSTQHGT